MDTADEEYYRHLAWKKNAPHLYDTLLVFELPWPSLNVEWLPELIRKEQPKARPGRSDASNSLLNNRQRLILTTNTGGNATEYLRIGELVTPEVPAPQSLSDYDSEQGTVGNYQSAFAADLRIVQRIQMKGIVERARYMPQNPNVIATASDVGGAAIWDTTKFPYKPIDHYVPTVKLMGHTSEVGVIEWSPAEEGVLASADNNGEIYIWNMRTGYDSRSGEMTPKRKRNHLKGTAVNDLAWHPQRSETLATCGDDGWLYVHITSVDQSPPLLSHFFGEDEAKPTALAWNPVNASLLAVGFDSGKIVLLDLRTSSPIVIHTFTGEHAHKDYITCLQWNTWHPSILASASADRTTKIWNAGSLDTEPLFTHGGHRTAVTDICWNPAIPGMLASVSEDNGLHVYQPSENIIGF